MGSRRDRGRLGRRRGAGAGLLLAWAGPALGQQPVEAFLDAAAERSLEVSAAELAAGEIAARRGAARSALLPSLSATAGYTRNEIEIAVRFPGEDGAVAEAVISAQDQLDATVRADWTLLDAQAVAQIRSVDASVRAARAGASDTRRRVEQAVIAAYYRLVAARHLVAAADRGVATARENLAVIEARLASGLAAPLDQDRALADVARAEQARAEATLDEALATRALTVATGLAPEDGLVALEVVPQPLEPLERYLAAADAHPRVERAAADLVAARRAERASGLAAVPSVGAFAQERWTNAAGFGPDALWSAGVTATWRFDASRPSQIVEASRAAARADVVRDQVRQDVISEIHEAWHRVRASQARLAAAEAEEAARARGAAVARSELDAGGGSPLALSVAERDRFDAEVVRIRAAADLAVDQRTLRLLAGDSAEVAP